MGKFSRYDPIDDVILTDVSGLAAGTNELIDAIFDEIIALASMRPFKPYVVACWKGVSFVNPDTAKYYGNRTADLLKHVAAVVRYAADDPVTRAHIRAEMIKHRAEGTRSTLYETKEEALEAVRMMRDPSRTGK